MDEPINKGGEKAKYVCYAKAKTIPLELNDWMKTNPMLYRKRSNIEKICKH